MPRFSLLLSVSLAAALLAGCGGGGGLFATVPPPVEFAGASIRPGVEELPAEGTYTATLNIDRVVYEFDPHTGRWTQTSATPLGSSTTAQAVVGSGTLVLSDGGEELFTGSVELVHGGSPATVANLTAKDGSSATYPYELYHDVHTNFRVFPHLKSKRLAKYIVQFDRYSFAFNLD